MPVRIAQISDTHLSPTKPFFRANFDLVAENLRDRRPDIIINTGDLALDGADEEADLVLARELHDGIGLDCHLLPGNHDVGDHLDVARRQPVSAERLARYRRIIGPDFWTIDIPGWRLLGLNALTLGSDEAGDADQQETIRSVAASLNGRNLAIFLHKPLADESYGERLTSNRFMTKSPRDTLLACLGMAQPSIVMSGHVHQYRDTPIGGARHIWAPATSFMISDPWQPGFGTKAVGYLMHEFNADGSHRHRLMTVRGMVHHDLAEFPDAYGDVRAWGQGNA
ncbi:MAG: metallophosphoesterase [Methylocystis sp.]|nr:metallophosphoesterase [Methylocystis sp.]MCA3582198.1 metallophosphoesterase [Methylocystis sp.]MCA3587910.1 metallophosphoesterase [Methylocystis sp.]MCA3590259.1 metallophosphoesterase [Methylocystis sp.]